VSLLNPCWNSRAVTFFMLNKLSYNLFRVNNYFNRLIHAYRSSDIFASIFLP